MDVLDRRRSMHDVLRPAAKKLRPEDRQNRPQTLSARKDKVTDRLIELGFDRWRSKRQVCLECALDRRFVPSDITP